jgi:hypothetical protein
VETLLTFKQFPQADVVKGKQVIDISGEMQKREKKSSLLQRSSLLKTPEKWRPPEPGTMKLNVDGSWAQGSGQAGAGAIMRNHVGETMFSACRSLKACASALEAELEACDEGLKLALSWSTEPIIVEMD